MPSSLHRATLTVERVLANIVETGFRPGLTCIVAVPSHRATYTSVGLRFT